MPQATLDKMKNAQVTRMKNIARELHKALNGHGMQPAYTVTHNTNSNSITIACQRMDGRDQLRILPFFAAHEWCIVSQTAPQPVTLIIQPLA